MLDMKKKFRDCCRTVILFVFFSSNMYSQNGESYQRYYEDINLAEESILLKDYQKANAIYKDLAATHHFYYKDMYNAHILSELVNDEKSQITFRNMISELDKESVEIGHLYRRDQSNRKLLNKLFKSKTRRIKEDESNFIRVKEIILDRNYKLPKDDLKKISLIITHNVDKKNFDSLFIQDLRNLVVVGRMHPILFSNIYDRHSIINNGIRYFNNNWNYVQGNGVEFTDNASVLTAKLSVEEINNRRKLIFLNKINISQKMLPVYIKLGLKYYIYL